MRGNRESWLCAIDALIESRGTYCWLPLSAGAGQRLFPEVIFQQTERVRCRGRQKLSCLSYTGNGQQLEREMVGYGIVPVRSGGAVLALE